jgi:hypothetical protein
MEISNSRMMPPGQCKWPQVWVLGPGAGADSLVWVTRLRPFIRGRFVRPERYDFGAYGASCSAFIVVERQVGVARVTPDDGDAHRLWHLGPVSLT